MTKLDLTNKEFHILFEGLRLFMQRKHMNGETVPAEMEDLYFKLNMMLPLQNKPEADEKNEKKVLNSRQYTDKLKGISTIGNLVWIIGEQQMLIDGKVVDQYIYDIDGHIPANGLPFISLKENITLL